MSRGGNHTPVTEGVIFVENSGNSKLSRRKNAAVTMVAQDSCPIDCPFFPKVFSGFDVANTCYANNGRTGMQTNRLNATGPHDPVRLAQREADLIRNGIGNKPLRLHVVGDSKTVLGTEILANAAADYSARMGMPVWTYTHAHHVRREAWGRVSVLRSCHTKGQVRRAHAAGYAAAVVVHSFPNGVKPWKEDGFTYIPCPNQTEKKKTCEECRLCWNDQKLHERKQIIAFKAHGAWKGSRAETVLHEAIPEWEED